MLHRNLSVVGHPMSVYVCVCVSKQIIQIFPCRVYDSDADNTFVKRIKFNILNDKLSINDDLLVQQPRKIQNKYMQLHAVYDILRLHTINYNKNKWMLERMPSHTKCANKFYLFKIFLLPIRLHVQIGIECLRRIAFITERKNTRNGQWS